jgi:hypothetical protein
MPRREVGHAIVSAGGPISLHEFSHGHGANGSSDGQHQREFRHYLHDDYNRQRQSAAPNDAGGLRVAIPGQGMVYEHGGYLSGSRPMKTSRQHSRLSTRAASAFTITELMVTMAIFGFVVIGILGLHIFGLKLNKMVDVKLQATEDSRRAVSRLVTDIHGAGVVRIGTGDATSFTEAGFNAAQRGNAVQIYPIKTNTTKYVRYYLDTGSKQLMRLDSAAPTPRFVSGWVTNTQVFTSEDFAGNVLSNNFNNRVIGIDLEFYKLDNPMIHFSKGSYYDYYRLQTRVTRRALE